MYSFGLSCTSGRWLIALLVVLTAVSTGQLYGWPLASLVKIRSGKAEVELSSADESWVVGAMFWGGVVGPILGGLTLDRLGRKMSLQIFCLAGLGCWGLTWCAKEVLVLSVARFLGGIWGGVAFMVFPVYCGEVFHAAVRGSTVSLFSASYYVGILFQSLVGPYVDYYWLCLVSAVVPTAALLLLIYVPESPYYLLTKGRREAARASLVWLGEKDPEAALQRMETGMKQSSVSSYSEIFSDPASRRGFLMVQTLGALQKCGGMSILVSYSSVILRDSFVSVPTGVTLLNTIWFLTCLLGIKLLDSWGRKATTIFSCAGVFVTMSVASVWYYLYPEEADSQYTWIPMVAFMVHGFVYTVGLASVPSAMQGELFSLGMKAKCSVITHVSKAFIAAIVNNAFYPVSLYIGTYMNFVICTLTGAVGFFYCMFCLIETKNKTLEDIQDELMNREKTKLSQHVIRY